MSKPEFNDAQVLQQAQRNARAFILTSIAYLKQNGQSVEQWVHAVGEAFAPTWEGVGHRSALDMATTAALNTLSLGGNVVFLEGDQNHATVVFDLPCEDAFLGAQVSPADLEHLIAGLYQRLTTYRGLKFGFSHEDGRWTCNFSC
jgi:hypothetical protein